MVSQLPERRPVPQADTLLWMPFKNNASETVPARGVMRVTGGLSYQGEFVLTIDKPSSTFKRLYAVNSGTPVVAGEYGSCLFGYDGPICVAYEGTAPAFDEGWGVKPGSWKLNKNYPIGFSVIGPTDTTNLFTYAHQQPINTFMGKLNGTLSQGGSAAVSLWTGQMAADETSWDITAADILMKSGATAIASGKKVLCQWVNGLWVVSEAEC